MSLHLIIDGYNLIRRSPTLSVLDRQDLEKGRAELIRRLAKYKRIRPLPITVIFDGWNQPDLIVSRTMEKGIQVVFSGRGQKADELIIQRTKKMGERALVVTSDRGIQSQVERHGATVIPSEEFELKIEMALHEAQNGSEPEDCGDQRDLRGTRKKGPSRRLPRHMRKARRRIGKL
jgi:predicted RNA-binding protein with PIN domain